MLLHEETPHQKPSPLDFPELVTLGDGVTFSVRRRAPGLELPPEGLAEDSAWPAPGQRGSNRALQEQRERENTMGPRSAKSEKEKLLQGQQPSLFSKTFSKARKLVRTRGHFA